MSYNRPFRRAELKAASNCSPLFQTGLDTNLTQVVAFVRERP
jgi:hypothetical protein